jgi:hypothetical protein
MPRDSKAYTMDAVASLAEGLLDNTITLSLFLNFIQKPRNSKWTKKLLPDCVHAPSHRKSFLTQTHFFLFAGHELAKLCIY